MEGTSLLVPATLAPGSYQWQVEAYDAKDHKLAIGPDTVRFTLRQASSAPRQACRNPTRWPMCRTAPE